MKTQTTHTATPTDKVMINVAIADTLTREGYEESTVDMVFRAVNTHEELLGLLKDMLKNGVCKGAWAQFAEEAIAKAEGK